MGGGNVGECGESLNMPSPSDLGLPPKFASWRHYQEQVVEDTVNHFADDIQYVTQIVPVGGGKSPVYFGVWGWLKEAGMLGQGADKLAVVTASRGLQSQINRDFKPCGVVDIRGKANYQCTDQRFKGKTCEEAARWCCQGFRCAYKQAYEKALDGRAVVTNYAYWLGICRESAGWLYRDVGCHPYHAGSAGHVIWYQCDHAPRHAGLLHAPRDWGVRRLHVTLGFFASHTTHRA